MTDRKNILLIGMDDAFAFWRFKSCFGAQLQTPNLDRICEVSSAFTAAYCQIPVCGPSRASAMSGLSPYETGIFDNYTNIFEVLRPEQMWQFRLKQDGYYCSTAGKIHHGYKPLPPDIHNTLYSHPSRRVHFGPKPEAEFINFGGRMGGGGTTNAKEDRQYYDYRSSQDAIRFLNAYDSDQPFYREVGFHHPHPPFRTPVRFKELYNMDDFIRPNEWAQGFDLSAFTNVFMSENMDTQEAIEDWQKSIRNYFSAFSHVDYQIGRVWDALKASPHADNTVVVIFSDHGYHMGDKNRFRKFTLWEEATRIPFIIHDPQSQGQMVDDPVALVDMGPTILDYAGARPMEHSVGQSLRNVVSGTRDSDRAVPTFWYGSASIRKGDHRITLYQDGSSEFHNVHSDPWLTTNVAGKDPAYDGMHKALIDTCRDYGVLIVEDGKSATEAAHYVSVHKGGAQPDRLPSDGIITVGDALPDHVDPGHRKHFATLAENGTLTLAPGLKELLFASDTNGGVTHFRVACNDEGNRIYIFGGHNRFTLDVVGGAGHDHIETQSYSLIARLGSGSSMVKAGASDAEIYGGTGLATIHAIAGNNLIHGGQGCATIYGGKGNDTIYSGAGSNIIDTGAGDNRVIIDGGTNRVILGDGANTVVIERTALPQTIEGVSATTILDLSDWAPIAPVTLDQIGDDVAITCKTERVLILNMDQNALKAVLKGVSVAA